MVGYNNVKIFIPPLLPSPHKLCLWLCVGYTVFTFSVLSSMSIHPLHFCFLLLILLNKLSEGSHTFGGGGGEPWVGWGGLISKLGEVSKLGHEKGN